LKPAGQLSVQINDQSLVHNNAERAQILIRHCATFHSGERLESRELSEPADPYSSGLFPLCVATHDHGVRQLFDLSTLLLLLDCRPGDRVLDLGAGPGFSSEMLARLGYTVIAADPDHTALRNNRRRPSYDSSRIQGTVRVVQGIAESLPFQDASFDGVVAMSVMHHVSDLGAATSELARVLRPGAHAVFCEPGLDHLEQTLTKRAMREMGETDRAFDVLAFLRDARERGFSDAILPATLMPSLRLLPISEIDLYLSGQHPRQWLTPQGVIGELHRHHAYALLKRAGERPKTSRRPDGLRCEMAVTGVPAQGNSGDRFEVTVRVTNTGDSVWLSAPTPLGGFVTTGYKLLADDGRSVPEQLPRAFLSGDVAPGQSATLSLAVLIPPGLPRGRYSLHFDMVDELVCWFSDLTGTAASVHQIVVG